MNPSPPIQLSSQQSRRAWRWVLANQGIAGDRTFASALAISDATMGLHAARNASPYATVAARIDRSLPAETIPRALRAEQLVTVRCMRRTLHTLPAWLASVCHGATLRYRMQNVRALAVSGGITLAYLERIAGDIAQLLAGHAYLGHREIEAELTGAGLSTGAARLGLKYAWESGLLVYRNRTNSWHRETRTFVHRSRVPDFFELEEATAVERLVVEYFKRYGPATLRDASWWSGLAQRTISDVLARHDALSVQTPWSRSLCYMLPAKYEELRSWSEPAAGRVAFLAHEDVALKAYFESRDRYLSGLPQRHAFNQIGEVLPTIVRDGAVVGLWRWDPATRRVRYRHFEDLAGLTGGEARRESATMTALLRAGHRRSDRIPHEEL